MSSDKPSSIVFVILISLILNCDKFTASCNKIENVWRRAGRLTGLLLQNCMQFSSDGSQEEFLLILQQCLKRGSLVILDKSLKSDTIKFANGIELVRYRNENDTDINRDLPVLGTSFKLNEKETDWTNQILHRIAHVLHTHVLKIRLNGHEEFNNTTDQARGRRKRHNMMLSLLMFGMTAIGLIMVPMGFQFLAVLGGKALLLAKMALILTAIQGLKKIATSNLNYGLYSAPPEHHGQCKGEGCNANFKDLEADDSIYVAFDVDDIPQLNEDNYDINPWHYDRQWPYDIESHDVGTRHNYYDVPDQQTDLLHPLHPRVDHYKI